MKNIVLVTVNTILGVIMLMIVMTVYGRVNRSMELQSNLSSVVEETVENLTINNKYNIGNTSEFLADFIEALCMSMETESDIIVDILQCDKEKGILAVKVTAEYKHPNGKIGTVMCERNVILNRLQEECIQSHRVSFYIGDKLYKEYVVKEGNVISAPAEPKSSAGMFFGWIDENGGQADFTHGVTQDMSYFADIR